MKEKQIDGIVRWLVGVGVGVEGEPVGGVGVRVRVRGEPVGGVGVRWFWRLGRTRVAG